MNRVGQTIQPSSTGSRVGDGDSLTVTYVSGRLRSFSPQVVFGPTFTSG